MESSEKSKSKVLVTGSNGLLGQKLTDLFIGLEDWDLVATGAGAWMVLRARREGNVMQPWWTRRRIARVEQAEIEE